MDTIFMNSGNSKTSDPHRILLNLLDKINLKRSDIDIALSSLSVYYAWKYIKKSYKNNKFEVQHGKKRYSDIQEYSEYIIKKHEAVTDNP